MRSNNRFYIVYILFIVVLLNFPNHNNTTVSKPNPPPNSKELKLQQNSILAELEKQQIQINQLRNDYKILKRKKILTPQDVIVLERITELEAGNQKIKGKTMVANVVINRAVQNNKSITDIVNERGQFEPVSRGLLHRAKVTPETKRAVAMATYKDYTRGATYFLNPKISNKKSVRWFRNSLEYTTSYKGHQFYREPNHK